MSILIEKEEDNLKRKLSDSLEKDSKSNIYIISKYLNYRCISKI